MLNQPFRGYINSQTIMPHKTKDVTAKELKAIKEAKDLKHAIIIVFFTFACIITFAIWACN